MTPVSVICQHIYFDNPVVLTAIFHAIIAPPDASRLYAFR